MSLPRRSCRFAAVSPAPPTCRPLSPLLPLLSQPVFAFLTASPTPFSPPRLLDFSLLSPHFLPSPAGDKPCGCWHGCCELLTLPGGVRGIWASVAEMQLWPWHLEPKPPPGWPRMLQPRLDQRIPAGCRARVRGTLILPKNTCVRARNVSAIHLSKTKATQNGAGEAVIKHPHWKQATSL